MKKETRIAHSEGITDIAFAADGRIVTVGNDADVRIWDGFKDEDPASFSATDSCFGVQVTEGNQVIVGTENNTVEVYAYPKGSHVENKMKFTSAVNHVAASADGKLIVAGSADNTIQIVGKGDGGPPKKIEAHSGPVLSVALDPLLKYFASAGGDGNVSVWSLDQLETPVKKWFQVFPNANDITLSSTLCRMAWHPSGGKMLAVPTKDTITLYGRDSWEPVHTLSASKLTKVYSVVKFSVCGLFVAGGGSDGTIAVWDAAAFTLKFQIKEAQHITGLAFCPKKEELFCTDINGRLISVQDFTADTGASRAVQQTNAASSSPANDDEFENDIFGDGIDYAMIDDDEDDENVFSITKIKADTGFVNDEYVGKPKAKKALDKDGGDDDDDVKSVSSIGSAKASRHAALPRGYTPFTEQQKPFQPGSTSEILSQRFMMWNNVGVIRSCAGEEGETDDAIYIEFLDAAVHHPITLRNDTDGYNIGNVSNEVVALSSPKSKDQLSKLFCLNFSSWDSKKEWTTELPKGEEITGIALGTGWIAIATTENRIRLFSIGGVQKFVYDICGTIVALSGFENLLFVTYHHGVGVNGNQCISYGILKLNGTSTRLSPLMMDSSLPLSPKSTLSWIGFTDEGTPVYGDSSDMFRILHGRLWTPYCDMRKSLHNPNDHYWVVGASQTGANVRAVKCKGSKFPMTVPRPTVMLLEAKIPLCEMETEKSKLEDGMLQALIGDAAIDKMERKGYDVEEYRDQSKTKELLFQLFSLAAKKPNDFDFRATEYVSMMPKSSHMQVALKFASRLMKRALTDRLQTIGRRKMDQEEEGIQDEVDDFESGNVVIHSEYRTVSETSTHAAYSSMPTTPQQSQFSSASVTPVVAIEENPLLKKNKDEIRSLLHQAGRKNPFKKDSAANGNTSMTRQSSFTASLVKTTSFTESAESQNGDDSQGEKGMAKIDVWKKPVEKAVSLPEFSHKNPNRKSAAGKGGEKQATGKGTEKQAAPKRSNPFEKKSKDKENSKTSQRKLFDMGGLKSKDGNRSSSNPASPAVLDEINSESNSNPPTDIQDDVETQLVEDETLSPSEGADKKRKRGDELELETEDVDKRSRIEVEQF